MQDAKADNDEKFVGQRELEKVEMGGKEEDLVCDVHWRKSDPRE